MEAPCTPWYQLQGLARFVPFLFAQDGRSSMAPGCRQLAFGVKTRSPPPLHELVLAGANGSSEQAVFPLEARHRSAEIPLLVDKTPCRSPAGEGTPRAPACR